MPVNDELQGCGRNLQWPMLTDSSGVLIERTTGREKAHVRQLTVGRRIESGISHYERGILTTKR
jgi:hypothetical protein